MSFFRIALPALFGVLAFCGCSAAVAGIADPCALSPLAGTVCADGSLYAGAFARSSRPLFAMPCDLGMEGTLSGGHWRCSGVRSVFAHGGAKAGKACASQTFGGHDDWVLPSLEELMLLCRGGSEFALCSCPAV
ncbi:MAG: hypothetical protein PHE27_06110, partial [Alphaproteobacteria bacterium]|nr:hypothetical protein [Alphaproteobacteria bacterium]